MSVLYAYLINYTPTRYKRLESILEPNYILAYKALQKVRSIKMTLLKLNYILAYKALLLDSSISWGIPH